jgi:O-antigen/teichoic acid export membrane protein
MPILYTSVLLTGIGMFSPGLHIREKTKVIAVIVMISAALNILLNFLLIPVLQLPGAAIATMISVMINNMWMFSLSQKLYPIPVDSARVTGFGLLFAATMIFGCYWLPSQQFPYAIELTIKIAIVGIYGGILLWAKMISFSSLSKLRK